MQSTFHQLQPAICGKLAQKLWCSLPKELGGEKASVANDSWPKPETPDQHLQKEEFERCQN